MQKKKLQRTDSIIDPRPINIYRANTKSSVGLSRGEFEQSPIRASRTPGWKGRLTSNELGQWAKRDFGIKGLPIDHIKPFAGELPSTSIPRRARLCWTNADFGRRKPPRVLHLNIPSRKAVPTVNIRLPMMVDNARRHQP